MRQASFDSARSIGRVVCAALVIYAAVGTAHAQQPSEPAAVQQTAAPTTQVAPPTPRPPLPNRFNDTLPSWLRVRGEFRERVEGFENSGFNEARDDMYYLSRVRFNATATGTYIAGTVQVQDARVGNKTVGPTGTPFTAAFDLRQAFADLGTAKSPVIARVGRQELAYGDQRLLGHVNWLNSGRTFDAARLMFKSTVAQVDVFGASVVRILDGEFDKSGNGNRFAGAYVSTAKVIPKGTLEPYVFWRRDVNQRAETGVLGPLYGSKREFCTRCDEPYSGPRRAERAKERLANQPRALTSIVAIGGISRAESLAGSLRQVTTGIRLVGRMPATLDYNVEMDVQSGSLATDDVRAWAGHLQLRATLPGKQLPHVTGEYNYASGDEEPTDGTRRTFDQLYPTPHDKYGLADLIGWRNLHHVRVGFDVTPFKATPITVNYHSYWLAENRDALYAASGAVLARVASGAASTKVGQELDIQVARPLTSQLAFAAGYSHLFTGPFLKEATPGKSYTGPFVMLTYVFLAER